MIDADSLWEYPVATNADLYACFGSRARNVVFKGVLKFDLVSIVPYFRTVNWITLRDIKVFRGKYEDIKFPVSIRKLSVIRNSCTSHESYKMLKDGWDSLEHLRILRVIEWTEKEVIDSLPIKCVEVSYTERPTAENLILSLNDDCLCHLQTFLPVTDWISLQETHTRFQHLRIPEYTVDVTSLQQFPSDHSIYKRIGPLVNRLWVQQIPERDLSVLMPLFTNLSAMEWECSMDNSPLTNIPTGLKELVLWDNFHARTVEELTILFRRLNPTLRIVELGQYSDLEVDDDEDKPALTSVSLEELHNIREYKCTYFEATPGLVNFLTLNKDHITSIDLDIRTLNSDLWLLLTEMSNLRILSVGASVLNVSITKTQYRGSLASLKDLYLYLPQNNGLEDLLLSLDTTSLTNLSINFVPAGHAVWPRLTNLKELDLVIDIFTPDIFMLTSLKKLTIRGLGESHIVSLVKGLPQLIYLETLRTRWEDNTVIEMEQYLRGANRKVDLCRWF